MEIGHPAAEVDSRIPVILVTGFLGSGKTTFLKRLAVEHPEWHLLFLVNEFAETSVDAETLAFEGLPSQSVVGGSLFCECKASDFIKVMRETVLAMNEKQRLDAIVIETSGIADPEAIGCLMEDHGLAEFFHVQRIVTIVAANNFLKLVSNLPVITAQVRSSDLIILNKTDLSDESTISQAELAVREINTTTAVQRSSYCENLSFELEGHIVELPKGALSTCDANPFCVEELSIPGDRSLEEIEMWIQKLPPEVLRVKGSFRTVEGTWAVERTVDSLEIREAILEGEGRLVLIAHEDHESLLQTCVAGIL